MELIRRTKESRAELTADGDIYTISYMNDRVHEMEVEAIFSFPQLEVLKVDARMIRYPHNDCLKGLNNLPRTIGIFVEKGLTLKMEALISGWGGCVHITNLFMECAHIAVAGRYARMHELIMNIAPDMTEKDFIRFGVETGADIVNSCEVFADYSPRVIEAMESPPSDSFQKLIQLFDSFNKKGTQE